MSPEVWGMMQRIPGQPFVFANDVDSPPEQRLIITQKALQIVGQSGKEIRSG